MEQIIKANQRIPIDTEKTYTKEYTTYKDGQERIEFRVYQGADPMLKITFPWGQYCFRSQLLVQRRNTGQMLV